MNASMKLIAHLTCLLAVSLILDASALSLTGVKSRKVHSSAGTVDMVIDTTPPINGAVSIEPRAIGDGHVIVFQFDSPVLSVGSATAFDAFGSVGFVTLSITGQPIANEVSVLLTGIPNNKRLSVSLFQVNGVLDVGPISMGFLLGDVNRSGATETSDIDGIKQRSGTTASSTNASYLFDLNLSGVINAADISAAKSGSGQVLQAANQVTLVVSKLGTGTGTVSSFPGISCGVACSVNTAPNTSFTLLASPDPGSTFSGWSGACSGSGPSVTISILSNSTCTANFAVSSYAVTATAGQNGSISPASQLTNWGSTASFTVTPVAGFYPTVMSTCGGALVGTTYTTDPIKAPCALEAAFFPWPVWSSAIPAVPPSASGKTYYVDGTNGANTNSGLTPTSAFKTIAKATSLIVAGDTVLIRKGLYREGIVLINTPTGTAAKPITFGSFGDGEVILDGSTPVTGWTKVSGTVWRAPLTFSPIGIVVNETPLKQVTQGQRGSGAPQIGLAGVTSGSGKWHNGGAGGFITADFGSVSDPNVADIVVPSNDGNQTHVYFYQKNYIVFRGLTVRGSGSNGIWGYGSNITIESCNVKFNGKSAISFQPDYSIGATNSDNTILTTHAYHNVLLNWPRGNNGYIEAGGGWAGGIAWTGNLRPLARGNIVHMNGGEGIITYGSRNGFQSGSALFEQNVGFDNWSVNMYFDNQPNNTARNNLLFNHPPNSNNFLYIGASPYDGYIKFSVCLMLADEENSGDSATGYAALANSSVYNNIFAGCRIGIRDYAEGNANAIKNHGIKNTKIVNNTILMPYVSYAPFESIGIYLLDNTTPSGTNRNVNSLIQNNLVYGFNNDSLISSEIAGQLVGINLNYNVYYSLSANPFRRGFNSVVYSNFSSWKTAIVGSDTNSQFVDPQLIDVTKFRSAMPAIYDPYSANLKVGSQAIGAGTNQSFSPAINYLLLPRNTWNVGAF